jgi:hypothetical protein
MQNLILNHFCQLYNFVKCKQLTGSTRSQLLYFPIKSRFITWPHTEVIRKWVVSPLNGPVHSCIEHEPLKPKEIIISAQYNTYVVLIIPPVQFLFHPTTLSVIQIPYHHKHDNRRGKLPRHPTYDKCNVLVSYMNFTFINIKGDMKNPHHIWPVWNWKTFGFEVQCNILRPPVL